MAAVGLSYCALRSTDHPAEVTDALWTYTVHIDSEGKVPDTGFDVPAGAVDIVDEGQKLHHNNYVFDHYETVHYDETVPDPDTCTTTPRSCTKNGNGSATCTGGDRVCSPDRQSCTGGGQTCTGGGQDCTGGGQDCRSGGPAICIPVPDTCTGGGEDCVPEHRDCAGGETTCVHNSHLEHRTRQEAINRPVPVYRQHFRWATWKWAHSRDLPQGAHDTNVLEPTPARLGVVEHERIAGVDPTTCSVTFTTKDDYKTYAYTPADCTGAFQALAVGTKKRIRVNATGSVEIVTKE